MCYAQCKLEPHKRSNKYLILRIFAYCLLPVDGGQHQINLRADILWAGGNKSERQGRLAFHQARKLSAYSSFLPQKGQGLVYWSLYAL